jgi:nickel/cobalt transporter (NicO) family protein
MRGGRGATVGLLTVLMAVVLLAVCGANWSPPAFAQAASGKSAPSAPSKNPFGQAAPAAPSSSATPGKTAEAVGMIDRVSNWILAKQAEYTRELVQAVRRLKTDNVFTAAGALAFLSFLYGVFHAVGPGHGKAIISSYVLANAQTARRGVLIAFMSSVFQAISAIAIVGIMALAFRATSLQMQSAEATIERISYALVCLVGAWMLVTQLRALVTGRPSHSHAHSGGASHGHGAHDHGHSHSHNDGHAHHDHNHAAGETCEECDHQHLPGPEQLTGNWSWTRALVLSFAVGIRPCTGAILVLVFALTQGLFWAGVFATFAMALGTAITVSALAVLAVVSRDWAAHLGGEQSRWVDRVYTLTALAGACAVFLLGVLLLWGSLGPARPF